MNKLEQAARQILEAVEGIGFVSDYWDKKITALREALAEQAEQEPVAYKYRESSPETGEFVFAAPVRTKDLTDEEVEALFWRWKSATEYPVPLFEFRDIARAVIAADREKNK